MKWNYLLICIILLVFLVAQTYALSDAPTHSLDTKGSDGRYFQFDNDCGLWFDADTIYFGDSNGLWAWVDDDGIKFYNLLMGSGECPSPWTITMSNVNVTVTSLFEGQSVKFSLSGTEATTFTLEFNTGKYGIIETVWLGTLQLDEAKDWTQLGNTITINTELRESPSTLEASWTGKADEGNGWVPPQPEPEPPELPPIIPPTPTEIPTNLVLAGIGVVALAVVVAAIANRKTAPDLWSRSRRKARKSKAVKQKKVKKPKWPKKKEKKRKWEKEEEWE